MTSKRRRSENERALYMISVAAELAGMHPQTLRIYERRQLVSPQRSAGNTRLYSDADIERLRLIHHLTQEEGINLAGVERILELEREVRRLRSESARLRSRAEALHERVLAYESAGPQYTSEIVMVRRGRLARREESDG